MRWLTVLLILAGCAHHTHLAQPPATQPVDIVTRWYRTRQQYLDYLEISAAMCHAGGWDYEQSRRWIDMMAIELAREAALAQPLVDDEQWREFEANQRVQEESWDVRAQPGRE